VIVLISFELTMGEMRGIMNLCIPFNTIEPLTSKLSANTWSSYTQKQVEPLQALNLETGVSSASVEMIVYLAETKLTLGELQNLAVGDVIMTEKEQTDGLQVVIEDAPKFYGHPGILKGHKAVRIGIPIIRPADIVQKRLQARKPDAKATAAVTK
jgi:flagellar motor switch protein FliM